MKRRYKLWLTLAVLAAFHGVILCAGFFSPYSYSTQDRALPYAPPSRIHFVDRQGRVHLRPFVYGLKDDPKNYGSYVEDFQQVCRLRLFVAGSPYKLAGILRGSAHLFGADAPARVFLLGSDGYGRDQFSRLLYGGQISLVAGWIAAGFSILFGGIIGSLAGFYGGWLDDVLMRGGELFLALPWLYLLFAVRAALPLQVAQWQVFLLLIVVIGLIGWARPARLIRGIVLSAKERNFVTAARAFGASDTYLLRKHILPQAYGVMLTQMTLLVPQYILAEVTLTFLGLGVSEPMASWGSLLSSLQQYYVLASYWWMFLPALLLIPVFLCYYAAADALQERVKSVAL
ncbi:MAG TPA: ABC transporter permease [Candidatus Acidoferrales bacterium]|nr:ABC transporter permease [Candidatus Acidoferrales bacterium]